MNRLAQSILVPLLALWCALWPFAPKAEASRTFTGTASYFYGPNPGLTSYPCTMAIWFRTSQTGTGIAMSLGINGGVSNPDRVQIQVMGSTHTVAAFMTTSGTGTMVTSVATYTDAAWTHLALVMTSSTSRTIYLAGGNPVTDTTTLSFPAGMDLIVAGARINTGFGALFTGQLAQFSAWNTALDPADIASLAAGFTARQVRPEGLVFYTPLLDGLQEVSRSTAFTDLLTSASVENPRLYP